MFIKNWWFFVLKIDDLFDPKKIAKVVDFVVVLVTKQRPKVDGKVEQEVMKFPKIIPAIIIDSSYSNIITCIKPRVSS